MNELILGLYLFAVQSLGCAVTGYDQASCFNDVLLANASLSVAISAADEEQKQHWLDNANYFRLKHYRSYLEHKTFDGKPLFTDQEVEDILATL